MVYAMTSKCDASFYAEGVKLRSRQAVVRRGDTTLSVVTGRANEGEVAVRDLEDGEELFVAGTAALVFSSGHSKGRRGRTGDFTELRERFGSAWGEIVQTMAQNAPLDANESRGYSRTIANEYITVRPLVGLANQCAGVPAALVHADADLVIDRVLGNVGAIAVLVETLSLLPVQASLTSAQQQAITLFGMSGLQFEGLGDETVLLRSLERTAQLAVAAGSEHIAGLIDALARAGAHGNTDICVDLIDRLDVALDNASLMPPGYSSFSLPNGILHAREAVRQRLTADVFSALEARYDVAFSATTVDIELEWDDNDDVTAFSYEGEHLAVQCEWLGVGKDGTVTYYNTADHPADGAVYFADADDAAGLLQFASVADALQTVRVVANPARDAALQDISETRAELFAMSADIGRPMHDLMETAEEFADPFRSVRREIGALLMRVTPSSISAL
jgi:hypothetical protein